MGVAVSVIVPVYNAQEWIEECVRSVSGQTFRNFELLLVDDGSRDRSGELCDLCAASEPRARVIHTPNGGVTAARACGLREAQGEWICFLDADDTLPMSALQDLYEAANGVDIVVGGFDGNVIGENERMVTVDEYREGMLVGTNPALPLSLCGKLYHRRLFEGHGIFDIPRRIVKGEDMMANLRLAFVNERPVRVIGKCVYMYRQHPMSCIHKFVPTIEYETEFHDLLWQYVPDSERSRYMPLWIKSRLKALKHVARSAGHDLSWTAGRFVADLKAHIESIGYRLPLRYRILLYHPSPVLLRLFFGVK